MNHDVDLSRQPFERQRPSKIMDNLPCRARGPPIETDDPMVPCECRREVSTDEAGRASNEDVYGNYSGRYRCTRAGTPTTTA